MKRILTSLIILLLLASSAFADVAGTFAPADYGNATWGRGNPFAWIFKSCADSGDSGLLNFCNAELLCWEASPTGTDVCIGVDSGEIVQISGGGLDAADITAGELPDARLSASVSQLGSTISFISPVEIADECGGLQSVRRNGTDTAWECYDPTALGSTISFITPAEVEDECSALQSVRRNSGDSAWECYTPASTPVTAANGGTGQDTSSSTGYPKITSGTWSVGGIPGSCEVVITQPTSAEEMEFCEKPAAITATAIRCECYGTCTTVPTIKICKGEDLGNDTCTTNLLSSTETTTLSCTTAGGLDSGLNSADLSANQGVSLVISNSPSADSLRLRVVVEYTMP